MPQSRNGGNVSAKIAAFSAPSSSHNAKTRSKSIERSLSTKKSLSNRSESLTIPDEEEDINDILQDFDFSTITIDSILQESESSEPYARMSQSYPDGDERNSILGLLDNVPGMDVLHRDSIQRASISRSSLIAQKIYSRSDQMESAKAKEDDLILFESVEFISPLQVKRQKRLQKKTLSIPQNSNESVSLIQRARKTQNVVKVEAMQSISLQLSKNYQVKEDGPGSPTAIAIHSKFIAIGMSKGLVLVFDHFQNIRQVLGNAADSEIDGPVTAIDVSPGNDYLICGYQSGRIVLWDMIKGSPLKADSESYDTPIITLRFIKDQKPTLLCVDSNGLVNRIHFNKMMGMVYVVDVDPIYDGSMGKILAMSHLPNSALGHHKVATIMEHYSIAALSTESITFIIAVEPEVRLLYRWPRPLDISDEDSVLPSLSFTWVTFSGSARPFAPILARTWGKHVEFLELIFPGGVQHVHSRHGYPTFELYEQVVYAHNIVAIQWLGDHIVAHLNAKDELCVYDISSKQELETVDISALELVFASYRGRNAQSFSNSFRNCDSILYLLGLKELRTARVQPWTQLVDSFVEEGEWLDALALALDNYEGLKAAAIERAERDQFPPVFFRNKSNDQCVVDILHMFQVNQRTGEKEDVFRQKDGKEEVRWMCGQVPYAANVSKKLEDTLIKARSGQLTRSFVPIGVAERVADILKEYVRIAMTKAAALPIKTAHQLDLANSHFQLLAGVCIEYCASMDRTDLLFDEIYLRFNKFDHTETFVELLEPYILSNRLCSLSNEVLNTFIRHYAAQKILFRAEKCLLRLHVDKFDVHVLLNLCSEFHLYSALIRVYNDGLCDYVTPIDILLDACKSKVHSEKERRAFGYKLLLYISYCMSGKSFPFHQDLHISKLSLVRNRVCSHLFSKSAGESIPYNRLASLLLLDAKVFLSIFARALDDASIEFASDQVEQLRNITQYDAVRNAGTQKCPSRLFIVVILSTVIFGENSKHLFGAVEHSHFFMFEARLLSSGSMDPQEYANARVASAGTAKDKMNSLMNFLALGPHSFHNSVQNSSDLLAAESGGFDKDGRQEMLIRLLLKLDAQSYNYEALLQNVLAVKMNRAAVILYKNTGDVRKAMQSYLADTDNAYRIGVFSYIHTEMEKRNEEDTESHSEFSRQEIEQAIIDHIKLLMETSCDSFVILILSHFPSLHTKILHTFLNMGRNGAKLEFAYLKHFLMTSDTEAFGSNDEEIRELLERSKLGFADDPAVQERFVRLLCEFEAHSVTSYLQRHNSYRVDACLKICREFGITDAEAYLLERTGDMTGALALILQTLEQKLKLLKPALRGYNSSVGTYANKKTPGLSSITEERIIESVEQGRAVLETLEVVLSMCLRNSLRNRDKQAEKLYFTLLDKLLRIQAAVKRAIKKSSSSSRFRGTQTAFQIALNELIRVVLERMVSCVSLQSILFKIVNEHGKDAFGDFKATIFGMLDTYMYEQSIYKTANALISVDIFEQVQQLHRTQSHCYSSPASVCNYCMGSLSKPPFGMAQWSGDKWNVHGSTLLISSGQIFHETCGKAYLHGAEEEIKDIDSSEDNGTHVIKKNTSTRRYMTRLKNAKKSKRRSTPSHVILESLIREDNERNKYLKNARGVFSLRPEAEKEKGRKKVSLRKPGSLPLQAAQQSGFRN